MSGAEPSLLSLVRAIRTLFERVPALEAAVEEERGRVVELLRAERWSALGAGPAELPAARHLPGAVAAVEARAAEVADAIRAARPFLPWAYSYPRRADAPDLRERIAFAEIVGPAAPLRSDAHCLGLTLIAPWARYPPHHHPAVELYLVLSGRASWTAGGSSRRVLPLGWVLHPSNVAHAMDTAGEPLLAVYAWTGSDVRTSSAYVEERG